MEVSGQTISSESTPCTQTSILDLPFLNFVSMPSIDDADDGSEDPRWGRQQEGLNRLVPKRADQS